jgi:hypothetical protein
LDIAPTAADFVKEAATSDMFEFAASRLAHDKGNAPEKTFASQMIADHIGTSTELEGQVTSGPARRHKRHWTAHAGRAAGHPAAFTVAIVLAQPGPAFDRSMFDWVATPAVLVMTLFIQRAHRRDTTSLRPSAALYFRIRSKPLAGTNTAVAACFAIICCHQEMQRGNSRRLRHRLSVLPGNPDGPDAQH